MWSPQKSDHNDDRIPAQKGKVNCRDSGVRFRNANNIQEVERQAWQAWREKCDGDRCTCLPTPETQHRRQHALSRSEAVLVEVCFRSGRNTRHALRLVVDNSSKYARLVPLQSDARHCERTKLSLLPASRAVRQSRFGDVRPMLEPASPS